MDLEFSLTTETVERLKPSAPLCVEPDISVRDALAVLRDKRAGSLCICKDGILTGIFTERDVLKILARGDSLDARIDSVMTTQPATVLMTDSVATAIRKMSSGGYRRLLIVDSAGRPTGKFNVASILRYVVEYFPQAVYNLPPDPRATMLDRDGA
ncbi:MAG: cyclic nucleotide-binding/CBS domain-containing protein [Pirellulales bacterium]